jgi:hypothetical protein
MAKRHLIFHQIVRYPGGAPSFSVSADQKMIDKLFKTECCLSSKKNYNFYNYFFSGVSGGAALVLPFLQR